MIFSFLFLFVIFFFVIDVTNGYVDVMRRPRIQVAEHLHYMAGIPCQKNTYFWMRSIFDRLFLSTFLLKKLLIFDSAPYLIISSIFVSRKYFWKYFWSHSIFTEMEKVASVASVASVLVLFFPPAVLIFGLCTRKIC